MVSQTELCFPFKQDCCYVTYWHFKHKSVRLIICIRALCPCQINKNCYLLTSTIDPLLRCNPFYYITSPKIWEWYYLNIINLWRHLRNPDFEQVKKSASFACLKSANYSHDRLEERKWILLFLCCITTAWCLWAGKYKFPSWNIIRGRIGIFHWNKK